MHGEGDSDSGSGRAATAEEVAGLRARAGELTAQFQKMTGAFEEITTQTRAITVTATSGDGLVTATVGPDGTLRALRLDPRIYHYPDASDLASAIQETIDAAAAEARRQIIEACKPFIPEEALTPYLERDHEKIMSRLVEDLSNVGSRR